MLSFSCVGVCVCTQGAMVPTGTCLSTYDTSHHRGDTGQCASHLSHTQALLHRMDTNFTMAANAFVETNCLSLDELDSCV